MSVSQVSLHRSSCRFAIQTPAYLLRELAAIHTLHRSYIPIAATPRDQRSPQHDALDVPSGFFSKYLQSHR